MKECAAFPNGRHDDMVDAMSQAIGWMLPRTWVWESEQAKLKSATRVETPIDALREHMKECIQKRRERHKRTENNVQGSLFSGL